MKLHITLLLVQNTIFIVLFLALSSLVYSYFPPYLFLHLVQAFVFIVLFYASWISQDNNVEAKTPLSQPVSTNLLVLSLFANIFFIIITVYAFNYSSTIEHAIGDVFLPGGSSIFLINGMILSLYLPILLKDRNHAKKNQST